ncbi:unnamed protein product, partial [marine sediment metagenome]
GPDIVFIDGAYLLADDSGSDNNTVRMQGLSQGLKVMARALSIPTVVTLQQGGGSTRKGGGEMENTYGSRAFAMDCDTIIEVYGEVETPVRYLKVLKQREGELGQVAINFHSREKIDFSELGTQQAIADSQKVPNDRQIAVD